MLATVDWIRENYNMCNQKYFQGRLPKEIDFKVGTKLNRWGQASCRFINDYDGEIKATNFCIYISNAYDSPEDVKLNVLLHEMIHILDFYLHPRWFVSYRRGRWVNSRGYNMHGEGFFMPEARRLQKYGFDITPYVNDYELNSSEMTDKKKEEIKKKKDKGYILGFAHIKSEYAKDQNDVMWFKTTPNELNNIISHYRNLQNKGVKLSIDGITAYHTHDTNYEQYAGCRQRIKGFYTSKNGMNQMQDGMGADKELVADVQFTPLNESFAPQEKPRRTLQDGGNGIGKVNPDGSVTYIMI